MRTIVDYCLSFQTGGVMIIIIKTIYIAPFPIGSMALYILETD